MVILEEFVVARPYIRRYFYSPLPHDSPARCVCFLVSVVPYHLQLVCGRFPEDFVIVPH
jgi:hypothetical protein